MIQPEQIFKDYDQVRDYVDDLKKRNDTKKIDKLVEDFLKYLAKQRPVYTIKELENVVNFLTDIPVSSGYVFVEAADKLNRRSDEFCYIFSLHETLIEKFKKYKEDFYEKLRELLDSHEYTKRENSVDNR